MKKTFISLLMAVAFLGLAQTSHANSIYEVNINTSALLGADASLSGPFSLDFSLNAGSVTATNTVTLSGFTFVGGTFTGSPTVFDGSATGSLASSISMTTNGTNPFNEVAQGFSAGTSEISFLVNLTNNLTGTSPAGFIVSIDDSATFQIPTTAPDGVSLLEDSFGSSDPASNGISLYESSGVSQAGHDTSGVLVSTPESGPGLWMLAALTGAVTLVRRSRKA